MADRITEKHSNVYSKRREAQGVECSVYSDLLTTPEGAGQTIADVCGPGNEPNSFFYYAALPGANNTLSIETHWERAAPFAPLTPDLMVDYAMEVEPSGEIRTTRGRYAEAVPLPPEMVARNMRLQMEAYLDENEPLRQHLIDTKFQLPAAMQQFLPEDLRDVRDLPDGPSPVALQKAQAGVAHKRK